MRLNDMIKIQIKTPKYPFTQNNNPNERAHSNVETKQKQQQIKYINPK